MPSSPIRALLAAASITVIIAGGFASAAGVCATPAPSAPAFAAGSSNKLSWTVGSPVGSGFTIEVASERLFDPDGSFKDSKIITSVSVGSSARERTFSGLAERRYYYHLRTNGSGSCTTSAWSKDVNTTQDTTSPAITITTPETRPAADTTIPTPFIGRPVRLDGIVSDLPGSGAPAASGPLAAVIKLESTTPGSGEPIAPRTVPADVDGSWTAIFTGLAPGSYIATAIGVDNVRNESAGPDTYAFITVAS